MKLAKDQLAPPNFFKEDMVIDFMQLSTLEISRPVEMHMCYAMGARHFGSHGPDTEETCHQ